MLTIACRALFELLHGSLFPLLFSFLVDAQHLCFMLLCFSLLLLLQA
jgi:hypothetical protein